MTFEEAWNKADRTNRNENGYGAIVEIKFDNPVDGKGYATLDAPLFYKNVHVSYDTVKRAWETFTRRSHDERKDSITEIIISSGAEKTSTRQRASA